MAQELKNAEPGATLGELTEYTPAEDEARRREEVIRAAAKGGDHVPAVIPANSKPDFLMGLGRSGQVLHNFSGDKMAVWKMVNKATGPECLDSDDAVGECFNLTHYYVHAIQLEPDDGGAPVTVPRVVLFAKEGEAYAFVSQGIADSLGTLLQCFDGELPADGVAVGVIKTKTRKGFKVLSLTAMD